MWPNLQYFFLADKQADDSSLLTKENIDHDQQIERMNSQLTDDEQEIVQMIPKKSAMLRPHFTGRDKHNRPYNIIADAANQINSNQVELTNLKGELMGQTNNNWYSVMANEGNFFLLEQKLDLAGNITINSHNGYEINTRQAELNLKENIAYGNDNVKINGPVGYLESEGFQINGDENEIIFLGPVKLIVNGIN
ncbi:MAG: LPS export ABC transporter periplasmic protein LptC [Pseudomonadota bacterium]